MEWFLLIAAGVVLASLLAVAGLLLVRRSPRFERYIGDNDVPGLLFGALGALYGALLAFVVFGTWDSYTRAEAAVTTEGAQLVGVYRDTQLFPEPLRQDAQAALRTYAETVVATEWRSHGNLIVHSTPDLLNPVWAVYRQVQPSDVINESQITVSRENLHALEVQRHERHLSGEQSLPPVFWPVLLAGSVVLVLFSYAFHQTNLRAQAIMTGLVTAMLTLVLLLIYSLNQPFVGPMPVSQQPILHALAQFDAIDLPPQP
ncbi:MAG: hypothetical protein QOH61_305 [Chloroflexota bacterium]|nr:hypothetical protein [Chloroflexota bacterium]